MTQIVTYTLPYEPGRTIDLCDACDADEQYHLGAVSHGAHLGRCEGNDHARARRAQRERLAMAASVQS